jgi:hypothetical protein
MTYYEAAGRGATAARLPPIAEGAASLVSWRGMSERGMRGARYIRAVYLSGGSAHDVSHIIITSGDRFINALEINDLFGGESPVGQLYVRLKELGIQVERETCCWAGSLRRLPPHFARLATEQSNVKQTYPYFDTTNLAR